jgi:hypothetical protein
VPAELELEVDQLDADAEEQPGRKSLMRSASAMMSSISWVEAQPKAVMCSSVTIGSPSSSFL